MNNRLTREREFHDRRFGSPQRRARRVRRFYQIASSVQRCYADLLAAYGRGTRVLEYGCGTGSYAFQLARQGARVQAIDISRVALAAAAGEARSRGLNERIALHLMNAQDLAFAPDTFDLVCGTGILHHLQLDTALKEIARVLKPAGRAIFVEPLGHNPLINLYRRLTPAIRSPDERPLLRRDLRALSRFFTGVDLNYYYLTTLAAAPFADYSGSTFLVKVLERLDGALFRLAFFRKQAWQVLIQLAQPQHAPGPRPHPAPD